jgi:hypothetical protein
MLAARAAANDPWSAAANGMFGGIAKLIAASATPDPMSIAGSGGLLGALANLQPTTSNAQTDASYQAGPQTFPRPDPIGYRAGNPSYADVQYDLLNSADPAGSAADQPPADGTYDAALNQGDASPNVLLINGDEAEHNKIDPAVFTGLTDRGLTDSPKAPPKPPPVFPFFPRPSLPSTPPPPPPPRASLPPPTSLPPAAVPPPSPGQAVSPRPPGSPTGPAPVIAPAEQSGGGAADREVAVVYGARLGHFHRAPPGALRRRAKPQSTGSPSLSQRVQILGILLRQRRSMRQADLHPLLRSGDSLNKRRVASRLLDILHFGEKI